MQRSTTNTSLRTGPTKPLTFAEKFDLWMINEGGRRIFFSVWVVLHLLVFAFGFMNYQLKDNLTTARATFGITYRTCLPNDSNSSVSN